MISAIYAEIVEILKASNPDFIVILPVSDDECLTVYSLDSRCKDSCVNVFIKKDLADFWIGDFNARQIRGPLNARVIASAINWQLDRIQSIPSRAFVS